MSYTIANSNNILTWKKLSATTLASLISNGIPAINQVSGLVAETSNEVDVFTPVIKLVPTEQMDFYVNLDTLETSGNFANWHLNLLFCDFQVAHEDIGTLTKDEITTGNYRFYSSFIVPQLTSGFYYLAVIDNSNNVQYLSDQVHVTSRTKDTVYIRYRNNKNIYNFNYETLTSFYNRYRISMFLRNPTPEVTAKGYDLVNGSFNAVRYMTGETYEAVTLLYNKFQHIGFQSAIIHSDFEIAYEGSFTGFRVGENGYDIAWTEEPYPLAYGTTRLQRTNSYSSNKML